MYILLIYTQKYKANFKLNLNKKQRVKNYQYQSCNIEPVENFKNVKYRAIYYNNNKIIDADRKKEKERKR